LHLRLMRRRKAKGGRRKDVMWSEIVLKETRVDSIRIVVMRWRVLWTGLYALRAPNPLRSFGLAVTIPRASQIESASDRTRSRRVAAPAGAPHRAPAGVAGVRRRFPPALLRGLLAA
jgi:hypothetical protein